MSETAAWEKTSLACESKKITDDPDIREGTTIIKTKIDIPATLALIGATLCWGGVPVMIKYLARGDLVPDGFTANMVRYPIAALLYLPWLIAGIRKGQLRGLWLAALLPAVVNLGAQTLWAAAPYHLDAGLMAFLLRLCVVWSIIGAFIVFKDERRLARSGFFWAGAALALSGFVIMSWHSITGSGSASGKGIAIIFFCGVCLGLYGVCVRYVMHRLPPLVVFSVVSLYTSLGLVAMAPLGEPSSVLRLPPLACTVLIVSAVVGIAIAHGLFYFAVQRLGVAICYLMLMTTPFVSYLGAYLWLGEVFTTIQWIGGGVLLIGSALAVNAQTHLKPTQKIDAAEVPTD